MGVCGAMIKRYEEMTETEAIKRKYIDGRVQLINDETNTDAYT